MRRIILLTTVLALGLTVGAPAQEQQAAGPNMLFGWRVPWGTWVWRTYVGPGMTIPALITFHADGTITGSDGTMFGGLPGAPTRSSAIHGTWERTGLLSARGTSLYLIFDSSSGVLIGIGRSRSTLRITRDFQHFDGNMFLEQLACGTGPLSCPDPLDPKAAWVPFQGMPADGFQVSGDLLHIVPAGALP